MYSLDTTPHPVAASFSAFAATPGFSATMTLNFATAINFFGGYCRGVENVCGVTTATWGTASAVLKNSNSAETCNGTAGIQWFGFVAPASAAFSSVKFNQVKGAGPSDYRGLDNYDGDGREQSRSGRESTTDEECSVRVISAAPVDRRLRGNGPAIVIARYHKPKRNRHCTNASNERPPRQSVSRSQESELATNRCQPIYTTTSTPR